MTPTTATELIEAKLSEEPYVWTDEDGVKHSPVYRGDPAIKKLGGVGSMTRFKAHDWEERVRGSWVPVEGYSKRRGRMRPSAWLVPHAEHDPSKSMDADSAAAIVAKRSKAGKKGAQTALDRAVAATGALPDSKTARAYAQGKISLEKARGIADYTSRRHNETDYDNLLKAGVDKATARDIIKGD